LYWLDDLEGDVLKQAKNLANHPYAFHHVAIMPDAHVGYGMPIGGVLATKDVIIPNAVGVDIGCGMCAVKTSLHGLKTDILKQIMGEVRDTIPLGFDRHKVSQPEELMPKVTDDLIIVNEEYKSATKQIGTLGGGNHFIDFLNGSDGFIWLMIHSGSRNIGFKVANYYNEIALDLNSKQEKPVDPKWELCYLPIDTDVGQTYFAEMQYCMEFALANRKHMMEKVKDIVQLKTDEKVDFDEMINIAHNYASKENHYGQEVYVHRKGATPAEKGQTGIIPGSQGHPSYIVKGKGNPDSFNSCAHGAGRKMGRKQAIRELDYEEELKKLEEKGVLHGLRGKRNLDEAPSTYKDISWVMKKQEDLVDILVELHPIACIMA